MKGNVFRARVDGYVKVPVALLYEKDLSFGDIGCYAKMQSLPDDFEFTAKGFSKIVKDGYDATRKRLRALEEHGYLIRAQRRSDKGRYTEDTIWITLDEPGLTDELLAFLDERNYLVISAPVRRDGGQGMRLNLAALGSALEAHEQDIMQRERKRAEDFFELYENPDMRYRGGCSRESWEPKPVENENPRSEPICENPTSGVTWDDANAVENSEDPACGKPEGPREGMWKDGQNPRSQPICENPTSGVTWENAENSEQNRRSQPKLDLPQSENRKQYSTFIDDSTIPSLLTLTKPATGSTCQVEETPRDERAQGERQPIRPEAEQPGSGNDEPGPSPRKREAPLPRHAESASGHAGNRRPSGQGAARTRRRRVQGPDDGTSDAVRVSYHEAMRREAARDEKGE